MEVYSVAIKDVVDNVLKIYFIDAESPSGAIKQALLDRCERESSKKSQAEWNERLPDDYEELVDELFNCDLLCAARPINTR